MSDDNIKKLKEHLEWTSEIAKTWEPWKQQMLGGIEAVEPVATPKIRLGDHVQAHGRTLSVALWYPRTEIQDEFNTVEVELVDVRAADPIRVEYDFERDGWVVKQSARYTFDDEGNEQDPDWQEVSFIQAWNRFDNKESEI